MFKITGKIKGPSSNPISGLFVEAYDSDVGTDDYLGMTKTDDSGNFELMFPEESFKEIFERNPDIYLIIRDDFGILHKTPVRSETKNGDNFDISISLKEPYLDIYSNDLSQMFYRFMGIGDSVDPSLADLNTLTGQMYRSLQSWSYYTQPTVMSQYGYPGPQVPRYPKKQPDHKHSLPWHKW